MLELEALIELRLDVLTDDSEELDNEELDRLELDVLIDDTEVELLDVLIDD